MAQLVSVDHFKYELIAQLRNAAAEGATTIVINSTELSRSIRNAGYSTQAGCEAMEAEIRPGDVVIDQRWCGHDGPLSVAAQRRVTAFISDAKWRYVQDTTGFVAA